MGDRHADLADLAFGERMIAVVAGLGRQIERDRKAGLTLGEVLAVELVRFLRGRMSGIGAEHPGPIPLPPRAVRWLAHAAASRWPNCLARDFAVQHTGLLAASAIIRQPLAARLC